jgi:hypothetical protein
MFSWRRLSLGLLVLAILTGGGCRGRALPVVIAGVTLQPGYYLKEYYCAPDFKPDQVTYALTPFTVARAAGIPPETFQSMLAADLARAFGANGLKVAPEGDCRLTGTVAEVQIKGTRFRFLAGQISAELTVSGSIIRGEQTLFAFRDRVQVASPINPGPQARREVELLLQQAAREFSSHLMDELLLHGAAAEGG